MSEDYRHYHVGRMTVAPGIGRNGDAPGFVVLRGDVVGPLASFRTFPTAEAAAEYASGFEDGRKPTPAAWLGRRWGGC